MAGPLVLAIDQGTSSTKCLLVDAKGTVVSRGVAPLAERHPQPGWVEQEPWEIWSSIERAAGVCLDGQDAGAIVGVGLSTQRESCLIWDRRSGEPLTPLLSWQDQRTSGLCEDIRSRCEERLIRDLSGLPLDPMFTAVKAKWLLDRLDPERRRARSGEIVIGTIDAWLLSRLSAEPLIEMGNASRTQLLNVRKGSWDQQLLDLFEIPPLAVPQVVSSVGPFPRLRGVKSLPDGLPIAAVMGDSHAALFAHGAFAPGQVKVTYGTGSSVMGIVDRPEVLDPGLCLTIAWAIDGLAFAAEGNIRSAGSTLRWAAEILGISTEELAVLARNAASEGVSIVPGFNGLGAPWWDGQAVGLVVGLTLGTGRAAIARAALESIPHQVTDVLEAVDRSIGEVREIFADGGPTRNTTLMQLQADLAGRPVLRAETAELSALGAARLAGLAAGLWTWKDLKTLPRDLERFSPSMARPERARARERWLTAVARARSRASPGLEG